MRRRTVDIMESNQMSVQWVDVVGDPQPMNIILWIFHGAFNQAMGVLYQFISFISLAISLILVKTRKALRRIPHDLINRVQAALFSGTRHWCGLELYKKKCILIQPGNGGTISIYFIYFYSHLFNFSQNKKSFKADSSWPDKQGASSSMLWYQALMWAGTI